jgi:hypothetical protein
MTRQFQWSNHALLRWRERSLPHENRDMALNTARLAKRKALSSIRAACPKHEDKVDHFGTWNGYHYLYNGGWVFVMSGQRVVTCFHMRRNTKT